MTRLRKTNPAPRTLSIFCLMRTWKTSKKTLVCLIFLLTSLSHPFLFTAAAKVTWRSSLYSFFKPEVTIEVHEGRIAHFFACSSKTCKTKARGVRRYQDKKDKSSTANLRHHAVRCFGEDTVNEALKGESGGNRSGNIFSAFASQGQRPVTYSHRAHTSLEFR
jgi:hypothetical protein